MSLLSKLTTSNDKPVNVVQPVWNEFDKPNHYNTSSGKYVISKTADMYEHGFNHDAVKSLLTVLPEGATIAGGAIAAGVVGENIAGDIDIFFDSGETFEKVFNMLLDPPDSEDAWAYRGYSTTVSLQDVRNDKTIRFVKFTNSDPSRLPIQLIKMVWFSTKQDIIDSFDFTVTQFAMDTNEAVYNPLAMIDLFKKRIVVHKMQYPVTTLRRLIKYSNKGYYVSPMMLLKVAEEIKASAEMRDPNISEYQR